MADPDPQPPLLEARRLRPPVQCTLWSNPELIGAAKDRFEAVETFVDESHLHRSLLKCRECGQLYFSEFYEMVDWDDGDDAQYTAYVPVETPAEIDATSRRAPRPPGCAGSARTSKPRGPAIVHASLLPPESIGVVGGKRHRRSTVRPDSLDIAASRR